MHFAACAHSSEACGVADEGGGISDELLAPLGTAGNLKSDAHLAALAIEHGALLYLCDTDYSRFHGLRWIDPLQAG